MILILNIKFLFKIKNILNILNIFEKKYIRKYIYINLLKYQKTTNKINFKYY